MDLRNHPLRCQRCMAGIDDNKDGDCVVCYKMSDDQAEAVKKKMQEEDTNVDKVMRLCPDAKLHFTGGRTKTGVRHNPSFAIMRKWKKSLKGPRLLSDWKPSEKEAWADAATKLGLQ